MRNFTIFFYTVMVVVITLIIADTTHISTGLEASFGSEELIDKNWKNREKFYGLFCSDLAEKYKTNLKLVKPGGSNYRTFHFIDVNRKDDLGEETKLNYVSVRDVALLQKMLDSENEGIIAAAENFFKLYLKELLRANYCFREDARLSFWDFCGYRFINGEYDSSSQGEIGLNHFLVDLQQKIERVGFDKAVDISHFYSKSRAAGEQNQDVPNMEEVYTCTGVEDLGAPLPVE